MPNITKASQTLPIGIGEYDPPATKETAPSRPQMVLCLACGVHRTVGLLDCPDKKQFPHDDAFVAAVIVLLGEHTFEELLDEEKKESVHREAIQKARKERMGLRRFSNPSV